MSCQKLSIALSTSMNYELLTQLFAVVAPVIVIGVLGYGWGKADQPLDTEQLSKIIFNFGTPCLVLSTLLESNISLDQLGWIVLLSLIVHAGIGLTGFLALKLFKLPVSAFLPAVMFPNGGNVGLPVCLFAFGDIGLALGIAYFVVTVLGQFTIGQAIVAGHTSLIQLLRTPIVWSIVLAVALIFTDTTLPIWISNTVGLLGQFVIPLMLFSLGVSLSRMKVSALGRSLGVACLRLGLGVAFGFLVAEGFRLEGTEYAIIVLQSAMPVAIVSYLFAEVYNNRPQEVAGVIVVSTLLSLVALPVLLGYLL